jgi:hypothetical protein
MVQEVPDVSTTTAITSTPDNTVQEAAGEAEAEAEEEEEEEEVSVPHGFEQNQVVWCLQARFDWWPGYIAEPDMLLSEGVKVVFGYDKQRYHCFVPVSCLRPYKHSTEFMQLPAPAEILGKGGSSKKKKKAKTKKRKLTKVLQQSLAKADYEVAVWDRVTDHKRHCLCRMLDDGAFMYGCANCKTCWFHPSCMGVEISEAERKDATLIQPFPCPFVEQEPHCEECIVLAEHAEVARKRKAKRLQLEESKRKRKLRKLVKQQAAISRSQIHESIVVLKEDGQATETDSDTLFEGAEGYYPAFPQQPELARLLSNNGNLNNGDETDTDTD